jgi:hypothetical protein
MIDIRAELERARLEAPPAPTDLEGLYRRRAAKQRRTRAGTYAVAGAIVVGSLALLLPGLGGTAHPSPATAQDGGGLAAPSMDLTLPAGSFYYMRVDVGQTVYETWWATDGSGRIERVRGGSDYGVHTGTFGPGEFFSDSGPVAYLSTDPVELEQQLRTRVEEGGASPEPYADWGGPIEWGLIRSIRELLEAPDVAPAQKAALVQVAANIDGVDVDTASQDPSGRDAILLTSDTEGQTHRWWFDPQSYQLLDASDGYTIVRAGITDGTTSTELAPAFIPSTGD